MSGVLCPSRFKNNSQPGPCQPPRRTSTPWENVHLVLPEVQLSLHQCCPINMRAEKRRFKAAAPSTVACSTTSCIITIAPIAAVFRKTIDVKVMRSLRPDRMMQLVVEQATVDGAAALNLRFSARILIGQH